MPPKSSQAPPRTAGSLPESEIEVACPLRNRDGTACRKRCVGDKRYRSMQEHIRRAHPEHYIAKLPATEASFLLMVRSAPTERPPGQLQKPQNRVGAHDEADQTVVENNDALASPLPLFEDASSDPAPVHVSNPSDPAPFSSDFTPFTSELPPAPTPGLTNSVESLVEDAAWSASTPFVANYSDWAAAGDWNQQFYPDNSFGFKQALGNSPGVPGISINERSSPPADQMFAMGSDDPTDTQKLHAAARPESKNLPGDGSAGLFGAEPELPPALGVSSVNERLAQRLVDEKNQEINEWLTHRRAGSLSKASHTPAKVRVKKEAGLAVREIPLGPQNENTPKPNRNHNPSHASHGGEPASGDMKLKSDSSVRFGIHGSEPTTRQQPDTSQAAIQKFETMCADQESITSMMLAASYAARRQSVPSNFEATANRSNFLKAFNQGVNSSKQPSLQASSTLPRRFFQRLKRLRSNSDDDASKDSAPAHFEDCEVKPHKRSKSCREATAPMICDKSSQSFITNTLINGEPFPTYLGANHATLAGTEAQGSTFDMPDAGRLEEEGYFNDTWYPIACVANSQPTEVVPDGLGIEWVQNEATAETEACKNDWPSAPKHQEVSPKSIPVSCEDQKAGANVETKATKQLNPESTTTEDHTDAKDTGVQVNLQPLSLELGRHPESPGANFHERTSFNGVRGSVGSAVTMVEPNPTETQAVEPVLGYPGLSSGSTLKQVGLAKIQFELLSLADQHYHLDNENSLGVRDEEKSNDADTDVDTDAAAAAAAAAAADADADADADVDADADADADADGDVDVDVVGGHAAGQPDRVNGVQNGENTQSSSQKNGRSSSSCDDSCTANCAHPADSVMRGDGEKPLQRQSQNSLGLRTTPNLLRFACPYQVHDLSRRCLGRSSHNPEGGCTGINQLRQHLSRRHSRSYRCQRCWKSFDAKHQVEEHEKHQPPCEKQVMPSGEVFMNGDCEKELESKASGSEEDMWWDIFRLVIPGMRNRDVDSLKAEYWPYYVHVDPSCMIPSITLSNAAFKNTQTTDSVIELPFASTEDSRPHGSKSTMALPASSVSKLTSHAISVPLFQLVASPTQGVAPPSTGGGTNEVISALQSPSSTSNSSPTPLSTVSTLYNWSSQQSLSSPLSDQFLMQKSYERLKTRNSRAEAENAELREANLKSCADLSRVHSILEAIRTSGSLPTELPEKLLQMSEILSGVKDRLR